MLFTSDSNKSIENTFGIYWILFWNFTVPFLKITCIIIYEKSENNVKYSLDLYT